MIKKLFWNSGSDTLREKIRERSLSNLFVDMFMADFQMNNLNALARRIVSMWRMLSTESTLLFGLTM